MGSDKAKGGRYDQGSAGNKREKSPEAGKYGKGETPEKPMARGHLAGRSEGGNASKGSAKTTGSSVPGGGDLSGNEHSGKSAVESVGSRASRMGTDSGSAGVSPKSSGPGESDPRPGMESHVHHHEDIHVHMGAGIANEGAAASMMHANQHSGFGRPPMNPAGVVPMYTASQQGITMNDTHTSGDKPNALAGRGAASNGNVRRASNPVKKGRG